MKIIGYIILGIIGCMLIPVVLPVLCSVKAIDDFERRHG